MDHQRHGMIARVGQPHAIVDVHGAVSIGPALEYAHVAVEQGRVVGNEASLLGPARSINVLAVHVELGQVDGYARQRVGEAMPDAQISPALGHVALAAQRLLLPGQLGMAHLGIVTLEAMGNVHQRYRLGRVARFKARDAHNSNNGAVLQADSKCK